MSTTTAPTPVTNGTVPRIFGFVAPAATAPMIAPQRMAVRKFLESSGVPDPEKRLLSATAVKRSDLLHRAAERLRDGDTLVVASVTVLGEDPAALVGHLDMLAAAGVTLACLEPRVNLRPGDLGHALARAVAAAAAAHAERLGHVVVEAPGGGRPRKLDDRGIAWIRDHPEKTNKALAYVLKIDERTVRRYKQRIREAQSAA